MPRSLGGSTISGWVIPAAPFSEVRDYVEMKVGNPVNATETAAKVERGVAAME
jgi:hypothetical protein